MPLGFWETICSFFITRFSSPYIDFVSYRVDLKIIITHCERFTKLRFIAGLGLLDVLFLNLMQCFANVAADPFAISGFR